LPFPIQSELPVSLIPSIDVYHIIARLISSYYHAKLSHASRSWYYRNPMFFFFFVSRSWNNHPSQNLTNKDASSIIPFSLPMCSSQDFPCLVIMHMAHCCQNFSCGKWSLHAGNSLYCPELHQEQTCSHSCHSPNQSSLESSLVETRVPLCRLFFFAVKRCPLLSPETFFVWSCSNFAAQTKSGMRV
jgi:hypothetical protein